jgi:hypothetical protein
LHTPAHTRPANENTEQESRNVRPIVAHIPVAGLAGPVRSEVKPKFAIPIYYGTFPALKGTPEEYTKALGNAPTKVFPIKPGDKLEF